MRFKPYAMVAVFLVLCGCGGGGSSSSGVTPVSSTTNTTVCSGAAPPAPSASGANVQPIQVTSAVGNFFNIATTSITICTPGGGQCVPVSNVQVDTGSSGLRILGMQLTALTALTPISAGGSAVYGECAQFADGNVWGTLTKVDVHFTNGAIASNVPLQIINDGSVTNQPAAPTACGSLEDKAQLLGANGLIGVGLFDQDCGASCASAVTTPAALYYTCASFTTGASCSGSTIAVADQVTNPVYALPTNNNGVVIEFPPISTAGVASVAGDLLFGIKTASNNALGGTPLTTNDIGELSVSYNGSSGLAGFFDSGSSAYFFQNSSIATCAYGTASYYCPSTLIQTTLIATGVNTAAASLTPTIGNANTIFSTTPSANAFNDIGAPISTLSGVSGFDLGLPFFFGNTIYTGFENQSTIAGGGPFFACSPSPL